MNDDFDLFLQKISIPRKQSIYISQFEEVANVGTLLLPEDLKESTNIDEAILDLLTRYYWNDKPFTLSKLEDEDFFDTADARYLIISRFEQKRKTTICISNVLYEEKHGGINVIYIDRYLPKLNKMEMPNIVQGVGSNIFPSIKLNIENIMNSIASIKFCIEDTNLTDAYNIPYKIQEYAFKLPNTTMKGHIYVKVTSKIDDEVVLAKILLQYIAILPSATNYVELQNPVIEEIFPSRARHGQKICLRCRHITGNVNAFINECPVQIKLKNISIYSHIEIIIPSSDIIEKGKVSLTIKEFSKTSDVKNIVVY